MKISVEWLEEQDACEDYVALFQQTFGNEVELTRDALLKAAATGQQVGWLARKVLPPAQLAEYKRDEATAMVEYKRVTATALAKYKRVTAPGRRAKYKRVKAPAWAEFKRVAATALADILGL